MDAVLKQHMFFNKVQLNKENGCFLNAVLKQHIFFIVIFITNFVLNLALQFVSSIDTRAIPLNILVLQSSASYISEMQHTILYQKMMRQDSQDIFYCTAVTKLNCTAALYWQYTNSNKMHVILKIAAVSVGKIIHTTSMDTAITANIHLPSIHRVCVVQKRPFVESYGIQRLQQITTSSLRRCLAACDAPTYSSCNSVLFSVQEETCILLARPQAFRFLGGTAATVETAAQFFINLICRNDFTGRPSYKLQSFARQPVIVYAASNLHMQIGILHELFYGSKAAIRLLLWDSADEKECLKICIASITTDYCDAYYFSSRENTCLTMRMKKQYASPMNHGHLIVTKFYDDETLDKAFRDENEEHLMYPDHFTEMKVSLHEFREICVTQHWISTLIPNITFSRHYENIIFFHECINICRHLKNSEECKGIAYSKKMKTCMIAVDGNEHGEILLNNDQQYVTLSSCKKDRETERANNIQHVFCFIPELDEMCLLELYEPLDLSGWKIITRIENTFSFQECLLKCASVMNVQKCSAVNFIDQQCVLLGRARRASFLRSRHSVFAELLYCELKRKRETERKGNAPVNTSSSPNSDGRTNNLVLWTRLLEGAAPLMMMNESKFDMKTLSSFFVIKAQMQSDIKALMLQQLYRISFGFTKCIFHQKPTFYILLVFHFGKHQESSPMHSYVYIPLFDKVCLIEKHIPKEYPTASRIPIFMYNSFESCIAACSGYSTGELLCNAFMYSDITKACHLHFYTLNMRTEMCPVETGQSQFYLHHGCFNRNSTLLNAGVNNKNETDDKIIFLPDLHKSCSIRKRLVSESFFARLTAYMTETSLKKCLSRCIVKGAEACNSVIFSLQEKSCTLVTHQSTFSALTKTESSPMHSYVYIPLLDREYPIASRIPIFMYDSFESCIAACSTYSTREQLCNAFMYSDITKACHLHFYTLHLTAGMCPVETGQSQFYLHHGCFNRNSTLLNAVVNKKNETDDKIIFLPDLHKSCLIRKRLVSESFFARLTAYMTETSLKKCLSRCIVKGAEACNSVIFSLQEKSCTLVTHQSTFSALTKTLQSSAYFFEIDHCKTKVVKNPLLLQILSQNPTIPIQSISGYRIQHIPITESENATIIDLIDCTNMQCCLQCCILKKVALGCNAIFFNAEEKTCLLMKLNVNSSKTAELVLYNLYTDTDGKEKLILSNYEDTLRFKTSFVSLHEFHERCQIATFTSAYAENLKVHPIMLKANTLNGCLNACRSNRSDIFNCSGVLYSKHEETCYQLVEGTSHDQIVTLNGQTIVLLQRCVKDREEERRNNIVFFHYYFYELEEKCVFEFYDSKNFSGFVVYDNIPRANAFYQCVLKCASEQISKGCAAVLKSQQICLFFKRNSTARIFRKLSSSYFAELLYCESHYINSNVTVNHKIEVETKSEMPHQNKTCAIKNAVLKQHILFTLTNCNLMSVYVPKLDATCALLVKKINDFEAYKIERLFCSFESCIAICFQHRYPCNSFKYTPFAKQCDLYIRNATYHSLPEDVETGQSRHLLLHSCHKEISTVPVGKITETTSLDTDAMTASIHLPSIHRVCVVRKRPFVESYGIQRLDQITTSSLRRCLAACDAPTYSSCNSVLFSVQEETCILLERPQAFFYLGGTSPTVDSAAQFFIFVYCYNVGTSYAMQGFGRQPVIAYAVSNLHMQVDIHHELFYGSKAAIRLGLLDSADEKECLKKCIASIEAGYCDAYYFSSKENTCLTMQLKKQYTLPERLGHRSVTKFYDDVTLDITFRDESEECIMFPDHFTETEVSLHEFREICVTKHWISSLIPNIIFSKRYVNISFINECINICRHLKNSEECKGIAYSKKMKTCMIAVGGNEHGEILLSNDQQYVTLSSCKKDRETERANNEQHVLGFIPELDETCLLELYEPLDLSGWKIITRIENTFSLQECLLKCASVMNVQKCSAVNFIDQQCVLFSRAKRASFVRSVYSVFAELLYCE
ncbi:hypothetical protein T12_517 [Trichinella patagoniensis]|uniref:Apple domain-containing protein n=1 Tax=Trichinella patagoniensis TaxID=990121 RepID=A0A0V0ZJE6_9BILA|nr:hypothetical protein T12_517 [Trichinella patagoniensis]